MTAAALPLFRRAAAAALAMLACAPVAVTAAEQRPGLAPCRLKGVEHESLCGSVRRPLDPAAPAGVQIDVHYALLPALARNRKPDPVVFFAGGPGQSAIDLAGPVSRLLSRLGNRRDVVLIDQRGTGRSAPLRCEGDAPNRPLAEAADPARVVRRLRDCLQTLQRLPHGDLRHHTTAHAAADADAVRRALGAAQVDLVGVSYGSRVALEVLRRHPQTVRRAVLDGVAPPDMALPAAFSTDNQAALDAVWASCEAEPACRARHPTLRADWQALLARLPQTADVVHPVTGRIEHLVVTRETVLSLARAPLYVPALASALPHAVAEATLGRWSALVGLAAAVGTGGQAPLYEGMHFAVVCAEDVPRIASGKDAPGTEYGHVFAGQYRAICEGLPQAAVPPAFYEIPPSAAPVLLLSGSADPVTPPRHGERVAKALGARARHVVVPNAGHGLLALGCLRDVVYRFVDAETDTAALAVDAGCAQRVPRPGAFLPPAPAQDAR